MTGPADDPGRRVLFVAATAKDAELTAAVLGRAGIACKVCRDLDELCRELAAGRVGAVLVPEEAVAEGLRDGLTDWLAAQPPWSDLPVLVMTRPGADSAAVARAMDLLGNVTVLERPTRVAALVSAARSALRARDRQYQIRDHMLAAERAAEALREADRRKNEFLATLAHELRNPLAPVRNALHLLRMPDLPAPAAGRAVEMMDRQVVHIVRLVDDLLEVSRVTRGKIDLRREPVTLAAVVAAAVETSRPVIDAAGHTLTVSLPPDPVTLDADPVRLAQVFSNLLNNAAKYTDRGGRIDLSAELGTRNPECRSDSAFGSEFRAPGSEFVRVAVRDTGRGVPADMLPRVFDLFTQVDRTDERSQGGLGIGLTLVKSLVELHGGTVEAHSDGPGRGSEFVVRLPVIRNPEPGTRSEDRNGPPFRVPGSGFRAPKRVLVADDNRDAADSLGTLLGLLGAEVRVVYDGPEAVAAAAAYRPAVAFLDIGMPTLDGHEVARRVRRLPGGRDVTLIALTGWGQEDDRRRAAAAGFDHHLTKPADPAAVRALLASLEARPAAG